MLEETAMRKPHLCLAVLVTLATLPSAAQDKKVVKAPAKKPPAFIDAKEAGIDYVLQGEYTGSAADGTALGCQVIALGSGHFQAVLLPGGLPGAGWDGKSKSLLDGKLDGTRVLFTAAAGKRKYLAGSPVDFSASARFPPPGHADATAVLAIGVLDGAFEPGPRFELKKTERSSPTLGAAPPPGALILFDGRNADEWKEGKIQDGFLPVAANTKRSFKDFKLHLEFRTPFQPAARGQGRGNSGVKLHGVEIQVLDSFGLDGKNNECGGLYGRNEPLVNMCLPPLVWQTYDVEYRSDPPNPDTKNQTSRITVLHNGVKVHDAFTVPTSQGPINLQNHGNPVFYRNIWLVELP
jgi:hypothetical protein